MAKNLSVSKKQPMAMSRNAQNMEAKAASGNLKGSAYDAPFENNAKRAKQDHLGVMPMRNPNGLE